VGDEEYAVFEFSLGQAVVPADLTQSEQEIAQAVVDGLSDREIGNRRGTSPRTVANQLRSIYTKLGIASRAELIVRCTREGRTPP
jgi:DNA-binding NarL/FixJ family response regulator